MRRHAVGCALLVAWMAGAATAQEPKATSGPDFKALMAKTIAAWATLDPAKAAPYYAKDVGLAFYDLAPLKYTGWAEYQAGTTQLFAGFSSLKLAVNDDVRTQQRGNVAWGSATVRGEMVKKDGSKQALDARWSVIWEKRGNDWLVVHEHFSLPAPEPGPAAEKK